MYLIKVLEDVRYANKGDKIEICDWRAERMSKMGKVKILKYLGNHFDSPYYAKRQIDKAKDKIKELKEKIKYLEKKYGGKNNGKI